MVTMWNVVRKDTHICSVVFFRFQMILYHASLVSDHVSKVFFARPVSPKHLIPTGSGVDQDRAWRPREKIGTWQPRDPLAVAREEKICSLKF